MVRACILLLLVIVSCKQREKGIVDKKETEGGDKVYFFKQEDGEMNKAINEAIKTYPQFERLIAAGDTSASQFSVKMFFSYEDGREHMWVNELHYKNGKLYGVLDSDPMYIERMERGDTLLVNKDSVSDWLYVKHGKMVGGYTVRVMYKNLDEAGKKEFKEVLPFEIE